MAERTFTVVVDPREQKPLPLPSRLVILDPNAHPLDKKTTTVRIITTQRRLDAADYCLQGDPGCIYSFDGLNPSGIIERKFTLDELANNCLVCPRRRANFIKCLTAMRSTWAHPILLLEGKPFSAERTKKVYGIDYGPITDAVHRLCFAHNVSFQFIEGTTQPQRVKIGEYVARLLLNAHLMQHEMNHASDNHRTSPASV